MNDASLFYGRHPMAFSGNQRQEKRGFDWPGIIRTLVIQVLVLLAVSVAAIRYLSWSSDSAWSEFVSLSRQALSEAKIHPRFDVPVQELRSPAAPRPENLSERVGTCRGRGAGRDG
jgi:hypothetical protein